MVDSKVLIFCKDNDIPQYELQRLANKAVKLGARVYQNENGVWYDDVTHVVYLSKDYVTIPEKVLCGLASGKWTVSSDFVTESYRMDGWDEEEKYLIHTDQCLEFRRSLQTWNESGRPFSHMRAVIFTTSLMRKAAYTAVIKAGGGKVLNGIISFKDLNLKILVKGEINHVVIDKYYYVTKKDQREFLNKFMERCQKDIGTVNFVYYEFIRDYLLKGGVCDVNDYRFSASDYKDRRPTTDADETGEPEEITIDDDSDGSVIELSGGEEEEVVDLEVSTAPTHPIHRPAASAHSDIQIVAGGSRSRKRRVHRNLESSGPKATDKIQNYAELCRKEKENIAAHSSHKGPTVREETSQSSDIDTSESIEMPGDRPASFLRIVDVNRLKQTDQRAETTVRLASGLILPGHGDSTSDMNSIISSDTTVNEVATEDLDAHHPAHTDDMEYEEEYNELPEGQQVNRKPDPKQIQVLLNSSASSLDERPPPSEDVKPELKPFTGSPLAIDTDKLQTWLAALNTRFERTNENFSISYTNPKIARYTSRQKESLTIPNAKAKFKVSELYSRGQEAISKLKKARIRFTLLQDIQVSWNINHTWDKATFNFVFKYCLFREKCPQIRQKAYKLLSDYTFIHLNKKGMERERFVATFLASINYDKDQATVNLFSDANAQVISDFWSLLVTRLCKQSSRLDTKSGCYMSLHYLVNTMSRDLAIWWRLGREHKAEGLPMIFYFLKRNLVSGLSSGVIPVYSAFLEHDVDTQLPRKLLSMVFQLASHLDSTKGFSAIEQGEKARVVWKVAKTLSSSKLDKRDLYIEVAMIEPSILSSAVSSTMVKLCTDKLVGLSMFKLLDTLELEQPDSKKNMLIENSIHRLTGALKLHAISRKEIDDNMDMYYLTSYIDQSKKAQELHLEEVRVPMVSMENYSLCLKTEINAFLLFAQGKKECSPEAGPLASLLFQITEFKDKARPANHKPGRSLLDQSGSSSHTGSAACNTNSTNKKSGRSQDGPSNPANQNPGTSAADKSNPTNQNPGRSNAGQSGSKDQRPDKSSEAKRRRSSNEESESRKVPKSKDSERRKT